MTTQLVANSVSIGYGGDAIVDQLDLDITPGQVTAIIGPNGSGKSTLLRGLARLLPLMSGSVTLGGVDIASIPGKQLARSVAVLPQQNIAPDGIKVAELVSRGRYPHQGMFGRRSSDDRAVVAEALDAAGVSDLTDRRMSELSGGQRQRVWVAMVLAQQTDIVLLDEPTTYLDIANQVDLLELCRDLVAERGVTVVTVLHELNLAARYADELVVMRDGRLVARGTPREVFVSPTIKHAFSLDSQIIDDPVSGTPLVVPFGRHRNSVTDSPQKLSV